MTGPQLVHESPGFLPGPSLVRVRLAGSGRRVYRVCGGRPDGVDDMEVARINRKG